MRVIIVILLTFGSYLISAQGKKFKHALDTIHVNDNTYLENYDYNTFFDIGELSDEINFLEINHELMDACLFFSINKLRKKYHRPLLEHNMNLYKVTATYTRTNYSGNFEYDKKDFARADKAVNYFAKEEQFHASQLKTVVNTQKLMNLKGVFNYYYDKPSVTTEESDWGLVKGSSKNRFDTTKTKEFIAPLTYLELCNQLSKQFASKFRKDLRSKAYSEGSCSVLFDQKTLFKKKIPSVKVIFIFAGERTALIPKEEEEISIYPDI